MFDFKNYPELKVSHKERKKLVDALYKFESLDVTKNDKVNIKWNEAVEKLNDFKNLYALQIFEILNVKKPDLLNRRTKKYEKWNDVVQSKKSKPLTWTISLVEEDGGLYRLPEEYYLQKK